MTGLATTNRAAADDYGLGETVFLAGVIVGCSEFMDGPRSYCVETTKGGKPRRDWFIAADFDEEEAE